MKLIKQKGFFDTLMDETARDVEVVEKEAFGIWGTILPNAGSLEKFLLPFGVFRGNLS